MNEESLWREFLHAEAENAPTALRTGQLDRAVQRGRRRRIRLMGSVGVVVCALGIGGAVAVDGGRFTPAGPHGCATVPTTSARVRDLVALTVTVRGPVDGKTVPITAHWSSKNRPIFISTSPALQRAYLLDRRGSVVARIAPSSLFIDPAEQHSIGADSSVKADASAVFPLTTCTGRPAGTLPAGRYRLVVAATANVGATDLVAVPHEGGDFQTVVSAPVPVEIR